VALRTQNYCIFPGRVGCAGHRSHGQGCKTAGLPGEYGPDAPQAQQAVNRYGLVMRWQPDSPVCAECGFDWHMARDSAIDLVAQVPDAAATAFALIPQPAQRTGDRWSASMYLWHLVDVLRIGTERLLTLTHDPDCGLTCWDENALAEARRYQQLSPAVGLVVLRAATREWVNAASNAPVETVISHPQFGALGAVEIIRRNAHEVHHHLMDINRYRDR
jgi:hypothetical protein